MVRLYAPVTFQHSADTFWAIYRSSTCAVERRRAQFFALLAEGRSEDDVLNITKYAVSTARGLIQRYHALGLVGLSDGRAQNPGAPTVLTADEQQRLATQLREDFEKNIVWDGQKMQQWIQVEFGKEVYLARAYEFMHTAGFSPQKPRPQHVKGDHAAKEQFKTKS